MNPIDAIAGIIAPFIKAGAWLANRHNIVRIAYGGIGIAAIVAGSFMLAGEGAAPSVGKIVKGVAA